MKLVYPPGATPLDPDEAAGLIPIGLTHRRELDAFEQANVLAGRRWAFGRRHRDILTATFLRRLHHAMFGQVWRWAGTLRRTGKNIGVDAHQIPVQLKQLCDDVAYWLEHATYGCDELGARLHHRLVSIHAFANGNGRHARLATDVLMHQRGQTPFTWGATLLEVAGTARSRYIAALRAADRGDIDPLLAFVRAT